MQKLLKKSVLFSLLIPVCSPIKAGPGHNWYDNPGEHWVGIATSVGLAAASFGVGCWFRGKNYPAENLEKQQLLQEQNRKIEEEKNQQDAQRFMYKLTKRYESEFSYIKEHGELSKEIVENGAKQHADQTSFYHIRYGKKLKKAAEKLYSLHGLLSNSKQKKAEKIIGWIKLLREYNSIHFEEKLARQLEEKKEAKEREQIFKLKEAAKEEKIKAKKIKTQSFEESRKANLDAQDAIYKTGLQYQKALNDLINHSNNNNRAFLVALDSRFDNHSWGSMAQQLKNVVEAFNKNQRINAEEREKLKSELKLLQDGQETVLAVVTQSNNSGEIKKEIENSRAAQNQKLTSLEKRLENLEMASARNTATLDDIMEFVSVPSAPVAGQ